MKQHLSAVAAAAALVVLALGVTHGTYAASAADAYGYVSEAALWLTGRLRVDQQFVRSMPWPFADWSFAPAGYRPAPQLGFIVPTYAAGLPLVMAAFQAAAGPRAVFFVVPALGALSVWLTARLGARVHSPLAGAIAAVLLASSPSFLYQLMQPLSDVPAAAWWTLAIVLTLRETPPAAFGAGLAASLAILTRPNLAPLAAALGGFFVWRAIRSTEDQRGASLGRAALFTIGAVPGCAAVMAIQNYLYGSPLRSGYEGFDALFKWANVAPNLDRYPRWLLETQSPLVLLALAAPFLARVRPDDSVDGLMRADHAWLLLACVAIVLLSYVLYLPFGRDQWSYLRYLLPAYPALMVLMTASGIEIVRRFASNDRTRITVVVAVFGMVVVWQAREAVNRGAFRQYEIERRYVDVGRYTSAHTPSNAVFITGTEAGSLRVYSGRLTIRFDWISERRLTQVIDVMRERGYHPYIALEEGEEGAFRNRFHDRSDFAALDWPPVAERSQPIRVRIYDPLDRGQAAAGRRPDEITDGR